MRELIQRLAGLDVTVEPEGAYWMLIVSAKRRMPETGEVVYLRVSFREQSSANSYAAQLPKSAYREVGKWYEKNMCDLEGSPIPTAHIAAIERFLEGVSARMECVGPEA